MVSGNNETEWCTENSTYYISEEEGADWLYSTLDKAMIRVCLPIIVVLTLLTNLSFLFVVLRAPGMRTDTYTYLANLAVADLFYTIVSNFFYYWQYLSSPVIYAEPYAGNVSCILVYGLINTLYFTGIALVTTMTMERYLALCHPIKHLKVRGTGRTWTLVAVCWLLGLVIAGSTSVYTSSSLCLQWPNNTAYSHLQTTITYCDHRYEFIDYTNPPLLNLPWLIAMVLSVYMYIRIILVLHNRKGIQGRGQVRNQVAKMLIVNGVVFFLCQAPYWVLDINHWVCLLTESNNHLDETLGSLSNWIAFLPLYINCLVNPLIYSAMSAQYRASFKRAFGFGPKAKNNRSTFSVAQTDNIDASLEKSGIREAKTEM